MAKTKTEKAPTKTPESIQAETAQAGGGAAAPGAPTLDVASLLGETTLERATRPAMVPPGETVEIAEEGITAWHNGKKITAMWCNAANRNAYAAVQGLGWRRISDANDSAFLTMTMMASHAEQTNATVNVEIGTDNEIHQIYVW